MVVRLLTYDDIYRYQNTHNYLHIGLVQIALKPLTLQRLPKIS